jgi:hypothetical protein
LVVREEASMDANAAAEARRKAQEALSNAKLATDARVMAEWTALAAAWLAKLEELDAQPPTRDKRLRVVT